MNHASLEEKIDVNGRRRNKDSDKIMCVGCVKKPTEPFKMSKSSSVKLYCSCALMINWYGRFWKGQTTMKDVEKYERLSSLWPSFLT